MKLAKTLRPGDYYVRWISTPDGNRLVRVRIIGAYRITDDLFGRPNFSFRAERNDTGASGDISFGPEGIVMEEKDFTSEQLEEFCI